jgi:hypothetical protein
LLLEILSVGTGSGGTMVGSRTGCGGEGGVVEAVAVSAAGGGVGRATGCCFLPHARTVLIKMIKRHAVFNSARRIMSAP